MKLLNSDSLNEVQRQAARRVLRRKCAVYAGGCRKRGRTEEAEQYEQLMLTA
jgi:hypothetical protein